MKPKDFLKKKGIKLGIVVLLVVLLCVISSSVLGGRAGFFKNLTVASESPVRKAVISMTNWLEGIYGYIYKYDQLLAENESLRAQLAEAQETARLAIDANEENERLRELLNLAEKRSDFVFESAKIVSRSASNWASTFTISKGEKSGIEIGDCVVTEYGALVGQIIELGENWATVRTIIDVDMDLGALAGFDNTAGVVVGDFSLMQNGLTKLAYLTDTSNLSIGDTVLTSGRGGKIPQGLLIGTIVEMRSASGGQSIFAVVKPDCNLDVLSQIFIIKEFDVVE